MFQVPADRAPVEQTVRWAGSGSQWFDAKAGAVQFLVVSDTPTPPLVIEFSSASTTLSYKDIDSPRFRFAPRDPIVPNKEYTLAVHSRKGVKVSITVLGGLVPRFSNQGT